MLCDLANGTIKMSTIQFIVDNNPSSNDNSVLREGIIAFNVSCIHEKAKSFSIFSKNESNEIIGGATLWEHSDAIYIDVLWVAENYRHRKIGSQLIDEIVNQARIRKRNKLFVDTYDFQALDFYKSQGFYVIGKIEKYLLDHDRIYLKMDVGND